MSRLSSQKLKTIAPRDAALAAAAGELQLVDIRPPSDVAEQRIEFAVNIPFAQLEQRLSEIDPNRPVAFLCRAGVKSQDAVKLAAEHGLDALNLEGGAAGWRQQVDVAR